MQRLLADLREEDRAGHFALPVSGASAPGYHNVISSPMDLWTIGRLLDAGRYDSPSPFTAPLSSGAAAALAGINAFRGHLELIVRNAVVFNTPQVISPLFARCIEFKVFALTPQYYRIVFIRMLGASIVR